MALDALLNVANRLAILPLRCSIKMLQAGQLDENAGSTFHGGWGWALKDTAPQLWQWGYGSLEQRAIRPFAIFPPQGSHTWLKGELLQFELTLFGPMTEDLPAILQSIKLLGELGLGHKRSQFELHQVTRIGPDGERLLWSTHAPLQLEQQNTMFCLDDAFLTNAPLWSHLPPDRLLTQITTRSRLHIKEQGRVLTQAPSALTLSKAIARRLLELVENVTEAEKVAVLENLTDIENTCLVWEHTQEQSLIRYSSRTRNRHHIEGFQGSWAYIGPGVLPLLTWLTIGRWIHLGSKTSFGFGAFDWQVAITQ
ncbi:CRISPR system precrRNA processing endoribonuclease RAMP protein Cas6 [uncultured Shewanella sp.]|uniref:CRISPR system precrRNA processing endoribonuclease RAMP protein Cas6 n=1 Tax=uncultured Shewanella sp. TaxID=173975 RepID=UPI0026164356|nr:CRISPR system precrRNA processing endoribonuclease RAMP protein Cas6 [uncultured Shewanella sp.]